MIKAFVNCPESRVTIHRNPNCAQAKVDGSEHPQHVLINADTLSRELHRFRDNAYQLAAAAGRSDLWLVLDFQDSDFEEALVAHLRRLVCLHSNSMEHGELRVHC